MPFARGKLASLGMNLQNNRIRKPIKSEGNQSMARQQLFNFKHDGKKIWVYTGESTSDVYYCIGSGDSKSAGIKFNSDKGYFVRKSGASLMFRDAQQYIRELLI
jgi:hypothetical protein